MRWPTIWTTIIIQNIFRQRLRKIIISIYSLKELLKDIFQQDGKWIQSFEQFLMLRASNGKGKITIKRTNLRLHFSQMKLI